MTKFCCESWTILGLGLVTRWVLGLLLGVGLGLWFEGGTISYPPRRLTWLWLTLLSRPSGP